MPELNDIVVVGASLAGLRGDERQRTRVLLEAKELFAKMGASALAAQIDRAVGG